MSQLIAVNASSNRDCEELSPLQAFTIAMEKMKHAGKNSSTLPDIKVLLNIAGFSQNGRNRIIHLSIEEVDALCTHAPNEACLWPAYVREIHLLLSKMDQARKLESYLSRPPFMGRPYVTIKLACAIGKLTTLRYLAEKGIERIAVPKLRSFIVDGNEAGLLAEFFEGKQRISGELDPLGRVLISLLSVIRLLDIYCDELITPPRLKCKQNFDDFDIHMIETSDLSWMDDGGEAYLEAIRDITFVTHYDELPNLDPVLDWFLATRPIMDSNQIKRGWSYLEKSSEAWHQRRGNYGIPEMDISEYPGWKCIVADRQDQWCNIYPPENPYKIIPLTTAQQLQEESEAMHHCVVTYIESCIYGEIRIFSVREKAKGQRIATVELAVCSGNWEVMQLKGKCNNELIDRIGVSDDPLTIALNILVKWYNENAPV
jgi:hypothetical protein